MTVPYVIGEQSAVLKSGGMDQSVEVAAAAAVVVAEWRGTEALGLTL
eukprot:COSAG02_NODE_38555_length_427_cov_3.216463_1_plen_46_part_01